MNKKLVKEIDIFQRTLKCRHLDFEEEEIEIFDVESDEKLAEEEEIPFEQETAVDPEALYVDLDCVKRQVQRLLLSIKARLEPAPAPRPTCEEEAAICALQKGHHRLQCQINELIRCFKLIRDELRQMHVHFCVESKDVEQLWRITAFFKYWQLALKPDEGACNQRFIYIHRKKAEWEDVEELISKNTRCRQVLVDSYLGYEDLHNRRVMLQAEIEKLKYIFLYLFEMKNPSYGDDFDTGHNAQPLKLIEKDYVKRQLKINRALHSKDCKEYFKCDKIE